jgi:hypothetical protein
VAGEAERRLERFLKQYEHRFINDEEYLDLYADEGLYSRAFASIHERLDDSPLGEIVHKCSHSDAKKRYQSVLQIIEDLEKIDMKPQGAPA